VRTPVRAILPSHPTLCTPETPVDEVVRLLIENECSALAVIENSDDAKPVGAVTSRDVVYAGLKHGDSSRRMTAGDFMTRTRLVIHEEMSLEECARVLGDYDAAAAPVVDEWGHCRGVVTQAQIKGLLSQEGTDRTGRAAARDLHAVPAGRSDG
jgi:CBS domain-containing protein